MPLHRLLDRATLTGVLAAFGPLAPGADLSLVSLDGRLCAGQGEWPQAELAARLAQPGEAGVVRTADFDLYPLHVDGQLVGGLAARGASGGAGLRGLQQYLVLLLRQAIEKREMARETLDRYREINLLYRIGETIGACLDPDEIPRLELAEAQRVIPAEVSAVLLEVEAAVELKASLGSSEAVAALWKASEGLIAQVRQTARPDILSLPPAEGAALSAVLCAPLKSRDRVVGYVLFGRRAGQPVFTASDEKLVLALSSQAGIALEKAWLHQQEIQRQRLEEELAVGQRIQLSLLPESSPAIPGWEIASYYQAARQVSGDFYDFIGLPGDDHRLGLVIADVTGKGVPAALMMAFCRAIIRTESLSGRNPAAVLGRVNQLMVPDNRSRLFLSAFYATLDTHTGRLIYASAGHDRPLWLRRATAECQELASRGVLLGLFPEIALEERQITIAPGDLLVLYTDGVTEAMDARGQMFDDHRLRSTVAAGANASAEQVARAIVEAVAAFVGETAPSDDLTLLVIRRGE